MPQPADPPLVPFCVSECQRRVRTFGFFIGERNGAERRVYRRFGSEISRPYPSSRCRLVTTDVSYDELIAFVDRRMRMSHVYQPLLLRTLAEAGGTATLRQLALAFLAADEAQIRWYEDRI